MGGLALIAMLTSGVYRHDVPIEKYLALANQPEYDCVGRMYRLDSTKWTGIASCVLIDSLHILTAAHTVAGVHTKDTTIASNGTLVNTYVVLGKYARMPDEFWFLVNNQSVRAKKITFYPGYLEAEDPRLLDMALIELKQPVQNAKTIALNSTGDELGDTVVGVGFGASAPCKTTSYARQYNIKLAGQNIVDSTGGPPVDGCSSILYFDLDSPNDEFKCNRMGSPYALPLEYGVHSGDSGGGLFRTKDGRFELVGILSHRESAVPGEFSKQGYYGAINSWTRVSAFYKWIMANR